MSRFWRGLMIGSAVGVMIMAWMSRQRRPMTWRERVMRSARRSTARARNRMGTMIVASRRRASTVMPNRK